VKRSSLVPGHTVAALLTIPLAAGVIVAASGPAPRASGDAAQVFRTKNVVIMIADGWGFNHILAANYYRYGKSGRQVYERFPVAYAMSTFSLGKLDPTGAYPTVVGYDPGRAWAAFGNVNGSATDSAAAATALSTGVKTYNGAIGVGGRKERLPHLMEQAERLGKATGVVTTVQFSHATPAGFVAHNGGRDNYEAIAKEMLLDSAADVVIGAGHPLFDDDGKPKAATPDGHRYVGGASTWEALTAGKAGGDADADGAADPWTFIQERRQFRDAAAGRLPVKRLAGVFEAATTTNQARGGDANAAPYAVPRNENVPTLAEMARAALNVLDQDPDGFVLMVEGGAVDWAAHDNQAGRMIEELEDFGQAVEAVRRYLDKTHQLDRTLLVVTGDHETGYLTGPGSGAGAKDVPVWTPLVNNGKRKMPGLQWNSKGHTNSLVPFYATGGSAWLFRSFATRDDPVRGRYLDNTAVAAVARIALGIRQ